MKRKLSMCNKILVAVVAASLTTNLFLGLFANYVFAGKLELACSDTVNLK